jgi:hypothetical protein
VPPLADQIARAIDFQVSHGAYPPSKLYGDGLVSQRIANALASLDVYVQKRLAYDVPSPFMYRAASAAAD